MAILVVKTHSCFQNQFSYEVVFIEGYLGVTSVLLTFSTGFEALCISGSIQSDFRFRLCNSFLQKSGMIYELVNLSYFIIHLLHSIARNRHHILPHRDQCFLDQVHSRDTIPNTT